MLNRVIAVAMLVILSNSVFAGDGKTVRTKSSGWSVPSSAANSDQSENPGFVSELKGWGTLGWFERKNVGDLAEWDGVSYCDFDDQGTPGVLLYYAAMSSVIRFPNGDRLDLELSEGSESWLCFNIVDNESLTYQVQAVVTGGTGRFAGATGELTTYGSGRQLANSMSSFDGRSRGTVYLKR